MLDKLTKETFEPITGGVFELTLGEGQTLPLELVAVLGTGLKGIANREPLEDPRVYAASRTSQLR
jgi:hypothetical protein